MADEQSPASNGEKIVKPAFKREVLRVEALSDGVFAFALTLLVVSLEVPKTFDELKANLRGFVAFGICFTMLVHIWWEHNAYFRRYAIEDTATVVLNSILLFVVLFFVYPLKFLFTSFVEVMLGIDGGIQWSANDLGMLFTIYGLGYIAVFSSFILLYRRALSRRKELKLNELELFDAYANMYGYVIQVSVASLSVFLAVTGIGIRFGLPGWIYGILGPCFGYYGWSVSRRRAELEQRLNAN